MVAKRTQLADAITTELNRTPSAFSMEFTAVRKYVPLLDNMDLSALNVTVVPNSIKIEPVNRSQLSSEISVDIAVQKRIGTTDNAAGPIDATACDTLGVLVEEIVEHFARLELSTYPAAHWIGVENAPLYDPEQMAEKHIFTSVIKLKYIIRD